jgi:hypothetical protein
MHIQDIQKNFVVLIPGRAVTLSAVTSMNPGIAIAVNLANLQPFQMNFNQPNPM